LIENGVLVGLNSSCETPTRENVGWQEGAEELAALGGFDDTGKLDEGMKVDTSLEEGLIGVGKEWGPELERAFELCLLEYSLGLADRNRLGARFEDTVEYRSADVGIERKE
jgi:hypothetical protein